MGDTGRTGAAEYAVGSNHQKTATLHLHLLIQSTMYRLLIGSLILFSAAACGQPKAPADQPEQDTFFSLLRYFEAEADHLAAANVRVNKQITINGKTEAHDAMQIDFTDEFLLYRNADINRVAWLDKYRADSTFANGQLVQLDYQSLDKELDTEHIRIAFDPTHATVLELAVVRTTQSALATNRQELAYTPGKGYLIRTHQTGMIGQPTTVEIAGTFVEKE